MNSQKITMDDQWETLRDYLIYEGYDQNELDAKLEMYIEGGGRASDFLFKPSDFKIQPYPKLLHIFHFLEDDEVEKYLDQLIYQPIPSIELLQRYGPPLPSLSMGGRDVSDEVLLEINKIPAFQALTAYYLMERNYPVTELNWGLNPYLFPLLLEIEPASFLQRLNLINTDLANAYYNYYLASGGDASKILANK